MEHERAVAHGAEALLANVFSQHTLDPSLVGGTESDSDENKHAINVPADPDTRDELRKQVQHELTGARDRISALERRISQLEPFPVPQPPLLSPGEHRDSLTTPCACMTS